MPRPSPSSSPLVVLGRGRGLGVVLRTLRDFDNELTAIVATAERAGRAGPADRAGDGAIAELRRSIEALSDDRSALARALRRPLTIDRLGSQLLGNLMLGSLTAAFGDVGAASVWLGEQLGINGAVLPATIDASAYTMEPERRPIGRCESVNGHPPERMRFIPEQPRTPARAIDAIAGAGMIVIAPGALFAGVLAASSLPAIRAALESAPGTVLWIGNLTFERGEDLHDQLKIVRRHQVRVDAVLFDPDTEPEIVPRRLAELGIEPIARPLAGAMPRSHDRGRLHAALSGLISERAAGAAAGGLRD